MSKRSALGFVLATLLITGCASTQYSPPSYHNPLSLDMIKACSHKFDDRLEPALSFSTRSCQEEYREDDFFIVGLKDRQTRSNTYLLHAIFRHEIGGIWDSSSETPRVPDQVNYVYRDKVIEIPGEMVSTKFLGCSGIILSIKCRIEEHYTFVLEEGFAAWIRRSYDPASRQTVEFKVKSKIADDKVIRVHASEIAGLYEVVSNHP